MNYPGPGRQGCNEAGQRNKRCSLCRNKQETESFYAVKHKEMLQNMENQAQLKPKLRRTHENIICCY